MKVSYLNLAEGVYQRVNQDGTKGAFYERAKFGRKDSMRVLAANTLREAKALRALHVSEYLKWRAGVPGATNPYEAGAKASDFRSLVEAYKDAGCPGRKTRAAKSTDGALYALKAALKWPGWTKVPVNQITVQTVIAYAKWRKGESGNVRLRNGRTIELEIGALRSAFRYAVWEGKIERNPLAGLELPRFQSGETRKCRECRPKDADELHILARELFKHHQSEVLGWQLLFAAFTGARTREALSCRWDAPGLGHAGFIDGSVLHLPRAKRGVNPFVKIHPALQQLLDAMKIWRDERYPEPAEPQEKKLSKWFFPSRDPKVPVGVCALSHALARLKRQGVIPEGEHRTSHGLRAYYVTVRRSQGEDDRSIAAEIGDKTGASIIESTYGSLPPNWADSTAEKIGFLPKGEPAWSVFNKVKEAA